MTFKTFIKYAMVILALVGMASCKKKKDETTTKYLDGQLKFTVESYIQAGSSITVTAKGLSHPDEGRMGVYWYVTPLMEKADTLDISFDPDEGSTYTIQFNEDLKTYTVTCGVFASGFSTSTAKGYVTTVRAGVDGTGSIIDSDIAPTDPYIIDPRDNQKYYTAEIGGRTWMRNNLMYGGEINGKKGASYLGYDLLNGNFGRFYTREQAESACPEGWTLPCEADFVALAREAASNMGLDKSFEEKGIFEGIGGELMPDASFNELTLWEYWPQVKKTNSTGFSALPAGYAIIGTKTTYQGGGTYATFWVSDKEGGTEPLYRYIQVDDPDVKLAHASETFAANIRCVKKTF